MLYQVIGTPTRPRGPGFPVFFSGEAAAMAALPTCFDDVEELVADEAHVLFAERAAANGASLARAPAGAAASEGVCPSTRGLSGARLDCGERERVDDVVH